MTSKKFSRGPTINLSAAPQADPIYVTKPYLPPLDEFVGKLQEIWERGILTNNGPVNCELESRLELALDAKSVATVSNGSIAIELALEAAGLTGEVITTPYSFVATSHSILRAGLTPVFADLGANSFNIDPEKVEAAITGRTSAILAVHCYGQPCNVDALGDIAKRHNLALIYDAAHAFGVRLDGRSLFEYGDYSTISFHATKVFHTFEGGAICVNDPVARDRINSLRNFGITSETTIPYVGTNAKLNEISAAMGLLQLDHFDYVLQSRAHVAQFYRNALADIDGIVIPDTIRGVQQNYAYFPIIITSSYPEARDDLYERLKRFGIFTRRYFYPLLSSLTMYRNFPSAYPANLPNAIQMADRVLCLPFYPDLSDTNLSRIVDMIRRPQTGR
ncbi:dTDP-4-amino-4,6-dideoxygalactose transaminase [Croceicoccus naphthovorans]|uniref:Uncharacterized protein n=2 Tax=Croceicoccus naphthovorans TaxID=1348774 RepID=A0A0G3XJH6_9SPHN|nr:DegT/DnrJ/EryC1/StrS family aminotransferase [Croceicoccus naphthovorans]AKM11710.1 hypothetical protein AB433_09555 [Croceicoccus naphthovorans]MBB3990607.1 dTDP-4-amino-4,6-dideoxygalactose transaminase [Croceicoccus naphthovorans]